MRHEDLDRVTQDASAESEALARERFNSLSRLVPVLYVTIFIDALILAWIFRDTIPLWVHLTLTALSLVVIATRALYWLRRRGHAYDLDIVEIRRALLGTTIFGPILALIFSLVGFFLMQQGTATQQSLTLIAIWVVASASSFCVFSLPLAAMLIVLASGIPMCLAVLLTGDLQVMPLAPAFVGVAGLMLYVLRENHRTFKEIVNSRTKMKGLQDELTQNHRHLALAQRVGAIGSAQVNLRTGAMQWSDEFFTLLDLDPTAVTPGTETFVDAIHPDDRAMVREAIAKNEQGLNAPQMEFRVPRPDGSVRWLAWAADLVLANHGVVEGFIVTVHDITERVRIEGQLHQSQKLQAVVGQLTGGVAHDFNNLLAVILGRLQMLEEELTDNPTLSSWVRAALKAVERGATLTKSLLAFSRRQTLTPAVLDLNSVIDDVEEMLRRTLSEAYKLRVAKAVDLWRVEADASQVQNALLNLVLNARDAMPNGGALIVATSNTTLAASDVGTHNEVRPGQYVMLSVTDTGLGMPRQVIERAFEPFFTTKDVDKGSGLGLSIIYGFVKQSGGHVTIDSEAGRGTTVRIYLPRKIFTEPAVPVSDLAPISIPETKTEAKPEFKLGALTDPAIPPRGTETILLVEDNDDLRQLTRLQLERLGYTVYEASHGAAGLRVLRQNPAIDLLLTDIVMPHGMSGTKLAQEAVAFRPNLKVEFMSGYSEPRDQGSQGPDGEPVRRLQKPFHVNELATRIRAALD